MQWPVPSTWKAVFALVRLVRTRDTPPCADLLRLPTDIQSAARRARCCPCWLVQCMVWDIGSGTCIS